MIIEEIQSALSMLNSCMKGENRILKFQEFIDELLVIISFVDKELQSFMYSKVRKRRLKACLHQLKSILKRMQPLLGSLFSVPEIKKIYSARLRDCLTAMIDSISNPDGVESEEGFICQLNSTRALLKDPVCPNTVMKAVDTLLTQALTIAKLCTDDAFNEIAASCKMVLEVTKSLQEGANDLDFRIQSCSVHLDTLERRVNIAMIQLFLENMSDPLLPVKDLVNKCLVSNESDPQVINNHEDKIESNDCESDKNHKRKLSDLNDCIAAFDLACDRMELIGNYSIASTEDDDIKHELETAVSGIGYCSDSLVPAVMTYYSNPFCKVAKATSRLLVSEWMDFVKMFDSVLDRLIDPANLVQVAIAELGTLVENIKVGSVARNKGIKLFTSKYLRVIRLVECSTDLRIPPGSLEHLKKKVSENHHVKRLYHLNCGYLVVELEYLINELDEVTIERVEFLVPNVSVVSGAQTGGILSPVGDIDSAFDFLDAGTTIYQELNKNGCTGSKILTERTEENETPRKPKSESQKLKVKSSCAVLSNSALQKQSLDHFINKENVKTPLKPSEAAFYTHRILSTVDKTTLNMSQTLRTPGRTPGRMEFSVLTPLLERAVGTSPFTSVSYPHRSTHRIVIHVPGEPALHDPSRCNVSEIDC